MTANYGYLQNTAGRLKISTIILAGIILGLSYLSYFLSEYTHNRHEYAHLFTGNALRSLWRELLLMASVTVIFLMSIVNLWLHVRSLEFWHKPKTAIYDFLYHSIAAIFLGVAGVLFIVSGIKISEFNCSTANGCQEFELKLGAGALAMMSSIIFGATGTIVLTNRKDVEREVLVNS